MYSNKVILAVLTTFLAINSNSSAASDWSFEIEPYVLASSIEGDAGIGRVNGIPVDVGFDDILENLDVGAMLHFEAHHNNGWGLALDYGFMNLGADTTGPIGGIIDVEVHQGVFEALVVKRSQTPGRTLDYTFGIRWWDNDIDLLVDNALLPGSTSASIEEDWIDFVIGFRLKQRVNDSWYFIAQADVGGLGADFTSSVATGFQYKMSDDWFLDLRYKATRVDYQDGTTGQSNFFVYDTVTHGPIVGFNYRF